jgi:hypothetical protein
MDTKVAKITRSLTLPIMSSQILWVSLASRDDPLQALRVTSS